MKTIEYTTFDNQYQYMEKDQCSSDDACTRIQIPNDLSTLKTWHKIDGIDCAYETDDKTRYYAGELRYDESTFNCYLRHTIYVITHLSNETSSSCKMHRKFLQDHCYEDYAQCKEITKEEFDKLRAPKLRD